MKTLATFPIMVLTLTLGQACETQSSGNIEQNSTPTEKKTDEQSNTCAGLDRIECDSLPRCQSIYGRTDVDPLVRTYAGCRTAYNEDGDQLLSNTAITCSKDPSSSACYVFGDSAIPDGWERLTCSNMPPDCAVYPVHPCNTLDCGDCEGLGANDCIATENCSLVNYAGNGSYAGCRTVNDASGAIPVDDQYCGRAGQADKCMVLSSRPPDGWILDVCNDECG